MSDYGNVLINSKEEYDRDAAEANLVLSFGCTLTKDGDQWCCLLGEDLQSGYGVFAKSPMGAVERMRAFIYSGIELKSEGV